MTIRQRLLKSVYPLLMRLVRGLGKKQIRVNNEDHEPPVSFYSLSAELSNGKTLSFSSLKGKKVLLVNTASDCGYTPQYAELQKLYQQANDDVEIIAFPANDFKEQEKGSDKDIAAFCSINYGVSFPLARKTAVLKTESQHPVFQWLTNKAQNGWNDQPPSWNFAKFLVSEDGKLTHLFEPQVSPLGSEVRQAVLR